MQIKKKKSSYFLNEQISIIRRQKERCITISIFLLLAGFVISAICELERNAIQLALGSFYPTLLLSGMYEITEFVREINTFGIF